MVVATLIHIYLSPQTYHIQYNGLYLTQIAAKFPTKTILDVLFDLIVDNEIPGIATVYFMMSEENVLKKVHTPWISFCSDAGSLGTTGLFSQIQTHPRYISIDI